LADPSTIDFLNQEYRNETEETMGDAQNLQSWEVKASSARERRDAGLAKVEPKLEGIPDTLPLSSQDLPKGVLTAREIEITEKYSVTELLKILRERKISVEEVTRAFLRRAAVAQVAVRVIYHEAISHTLLLGMN
jgi:hypothetical protein